MTWKLVSVAYCAVLVGVMTACGGETGAGGDAHFAIAGSYTRYTTSLLHYGDQTYTVTVDTVSIPVTGELTIHPGSSTATEPQTATFTPTSGDCFQMPSYTATNVSFDASGLNATLVKDLGMNPSLKIQGAATGEGYSGTLVCEFQTASSWTYSGTFTAVREK